MGTRPHVEGASRNACRPTIDGLIPRIIADRNSRGSGKHSHRFRAMPGAPADAPASRFKQALRRFGDHVADLGTGSGRRPSDNGSGARNL